MLRNQLIIGCRFGDKDFLFIIGFFQGNSSTISEKITTNASKRLSVKSERYYLLIPKGEPLLNFLPITKFF